MVKMGFFLFVNLSGGFFSYDSLDRYLVRVYFVFFFSCGVRFLFIDVGFGFVICFE